MLEGAVSLDQSMVASTSSALAQAMSYHISDIIQRDSLPSLSHVLNGWGDVRIDGLRISDRFEDFLHYDDRGRPCILQCDPEGEFHPWQSFAYAVMAGVDADTAL